MRNITEDKLDKFLCIVCRYKDCIAAPGGRVMFCGPHTAGSSGPLVAAVPVPAHSEKNIILLK